MKKSYSKIGDFNLTGRLTIPSGIITTTPKTMLTFAEQSVLGIITSKSIGPKPRKGNLAPILYQQNKYTLLNAVGLTNPGIEAYVAEMKEIREVWPADKFCLTSIFAGDKNVGDTVEGDTKQNLVYVAKWAKAVSDALELNFGCPHSGGLAQIGRSPELVEELTAAVVEVVDIPVLVKLTPSAYDIAAVAKAAEQGGAKGIVAINTAGPGETQHLYTKRGSISGSAIKTIGVRCVHDIANAVDLPIIGMGGITSIDDVLDYKNAGADFFGIGSSLIGKPTKVVFKYLSETDRAYKLNRNWNYYPLCNFDTPVTRTITEINDVSKDMRIITMDYHILDGPGMFMMLQTEGGEAKPFSIANNWPLTFAVRKVGESSSRMFELKQGDKLKLGGPYGKQIGKTVLKDLGSDIYLVGGGTGIAPLNMIAGYIKNNESKLGITVRAIIGAKTKDELIFEESLKRSCKKVYVTTDDGSYCERGFVTNILENVLSEMGHTQKRGFINCGPEVMMKKAVEIEKRHMSNPQKILCGVERYTKCGMGLCGNCEINGFRACVDGPFFSFGDIESALGVYKRDATGQKVKA
jgi:dihydroorotate dehydrogenase (NAD+) catalytic subunit